MRKLLWENSEIVGAVRDLAQHPNGLHILGVQAILRMMRNEYELRLVRMEQVVQEAIENCETCRGSINCARCLTFQKLLTEEAD